MNDLVGACRIGAGGQPEGWPSPRRAGGGSVAPPAPPRAARAVRVIAWVLAIWVLLASVSAASARRVELELWTWALRPRFEPFMREFVAEFEAANPGISVTWVDIPGDAIIRKFYAAGAAGRLPDVVNLPDKTFLRFAALGGLRPLDGILPGDADAKFARAALDQCRVDGVLYGLPWYLSTEISIVNRGLLARGGLSVEELGTTWSEMLAQARGFRERSGAYLFTMRLGQVDLLAMVTAEGLSPVVRDGAGRMRSNLGDPAVREVLAGWVGAYREGLLPREAATADFPSVVQAFKDHRIAVLNADAVRSVRGDSPRLYEQLEVRPGITGAGGKVNVSVVQIAVGAQTRHPREAALLAWELTSARWQERLCREASRVPSTRSSLELPEFSLPEDRSDRLRLAMGIGADQLRTGRARSFVPETGQWPEMERVFSQEIKRVLLEGDDLDATLDRIDRYWERLLAEEARLAGGPGGGGERGGGGGGGGGP